jgi:hypothetical protein
MLPCAHTAAAQASCGCCGPGGQRASKAPPSGPDVLPSAAEPGQREHQLAASAGSSSSPPPRPASAHAPAPPEPSAASEQPGARQQQPVQGAQQPALKPAPPVLPARKPTPPVLLDRQQQPVQGAQQPALKPAPPVLPARKPTPPVLYDSAVGPGRPKVDSWAASPPVGQAPLPSSAVQPAAGEAGTVQAQQNARTPQAPPPKQLQGDAASAARSEANMLRATGPPVVKKAPPPVFKKAPPPRFDEPVYSKARPAG